MCATFDLREITEVSFGWSTIGQMVKWSNCEEIVQQGSARVAGRQAGRAEAEVRWNRGQGAMCSVHGAMCCAQLCIVGTQYTALYCWQVQGRAGRGEWLTGADRPEAVAASSCILVAESNCPPKNRLATQVRASDHCVGQRLENNS